MQTPKTMHLKRFVPIPKAFIIVKSFFHCNNPVIIVLKKLIKLHKKVKIDATRKKTFTPTIDCELARIYSDRSE